MMPEEQFKAFLLRVQDDVSLQNSLQSAMSLDDVVGIAKDHGYQFSQDLLGELSDTELESISGGCSVAENIATIVNTPGSKSCFDTALISCGYKNVFK